MSQILVLLVIFFGYTVQAVTGFAGTMLAMPLSMRLIGFDSARIILNFMGLVSGSYIAYKDRRFINKSIVKYVVTWVFLGIFLSLIIYTFVDYQILISVYGVMIILISLKKIFVKKEIRIPEKFMKYILILGGIIHGLFVSGGPLIIMYLVSVIKKKEEFRATVSAIWIFMGVSFIFQTLHLVTIDDVQFIAVALIPLVLSVVVGNWIHHRVSQEKFLKISYILLLMSGLSVFI